MPKMTKKGGPKAKAYDVPQAGKRKNKDFGVPKFAQLQAGGKAIGGGKGKAVQQSGRQEVRSVAALAQTSQQSQRQADIMELAAASSSYDPQRLVDASLTVRDSSAKAFMRELRKVIERSDVIIQVLDARDPEGTRSRWVEDEVRRHDAQGKKLLGVVNKIDLVPRANLEAWLKHLRHSFPCMPFKSSTQAQRQNLSQSAVPLMPSSTTAPGQLPTNPTHLAPLPTTSSSLGAPALLHLLKQYALSTPHSSLTVGIIGYPNVGKSSLINSLKRSRACGVAAMPGKTRVVQEVVLDKGVKVLDSPGVVLEDFGQQIEGEEGRRRQAQVMLRNCVKAELVEDPIAPVEVILSRVEPAIINKLYNIPSFDDVRDFLIKVALTRGRLGKGGIPDLEGAAVSVLRDWNAGKIPYHSVPPKVHASSAPAVAPQGAPDEDVEMGEKVGDAKILTTLGQAFSLEGLLDDMLASGAGEWEEGEAPPADEPAEMPVDEDVVVPQSTTFAAPVASTSYHHMDTLQPRNPGAAAHPSRLFTASELAVLPADQMFDRQKLKQQAKKAKKRAAVAAKTEDDLVFGFDFMGVSHEDEEDAIEVETVKPKRSKKEKSKAKATAAKPPPAVMEIDEDTKKENDFAAFLQTVGADDDDEEEL